MAGPALDRFRFPRRDGTALSHLRCQLEDSANRIHRSRAIRRSLHTPVACLCYSSPLHIPAQMNLLMSSTPSTVTEEINQTAQPLELKKQNKPARPPP